MFCCIPGDFSACSLAVWDTHDYSIVATAKPPCPIHSVMWDPFSVNEFISVGAHASILFWLVEETNDKVSLNVSNYCRLLDELQNTERCLLVSHATNKDKSMTRDSSNPCLFLSDRLSCSVAIDNGVE